MNKTELVAAIAEQAEMTKKDAEKAVFSIPALDRFRTFSITVNFKGL